MPQRSSNLHQLPKNSIENMPPALGLSPPPQWIVEVRKWSIHVNTENAMILLITELVADSSHKPFFRHHSTIAKVAIADFLQDMMFRRDRILVLHRCNPQGEVSSHHLMLLLRLWSCIVQIENPLEENPSPGTFIISQLWTLETSRN